MSVNAITGAVRRRKAQFYVVEHFPMTLVDARRRLFPRQAPPFKWIIAVVSDVRAGVVCVCECGGGGVAAPSMGYGYVCAVVCI